MPPASARLMLTLAARVVFYHENRPRPSTRVIGNDQAVHEGAELQERVPIAAVAGQPRSPTPRRPCRRRSPRADARSRGGLDHHLTGQAHRR